MSVILRLIYKTVNVSVFYQQIKCTNPFQMPASSERRSLSAPMRISVSGSRRRTVRTGDTPGPEPEPESELPRHPAWSHQGTQGPDTSHRLRAEGRKMSNRFHLTISNF